jgi:hypothetical protein
MKRVLRSCFCQQAKKKDLQRQSLKTSTQPEGIIKVQRNCYSQQAINIQQEGMEGVLRSCYLQQAINIQQEGMEGILRSCYVQRAIDRQE